MAEKRSYSNVFSTLDAKSKARYLEKVSYIANEDPYLLKKEDFSDNISLLPDLSYPDIVIYLLNTTSFVTLEEVKNYKSLQSYRYFVSGWVLEVLWRRYQGHEVVLVIGTVRHSFAASKSPLRPWVIIHNNGTVAVGHCTCMAGLAETCSHVGALLHWVESTIRMSKEVSCTSLSNEWIVPRAVKSIPYQQLKDIQFRTGVSGSSQSDEQREGGINLPTQEEKLSFYAAIAKGYGRPIVLSLISPYSDSFAQAKDNLPSTLQTLYKPEHLTKSYAELLTISKGMSDEVVTSVMVNNLEMITRKQTKSQEWFRYRAGRITASRFRQVLHTSISKPSYSLLMAVCYPESTAFFRSPATEWGCLHESDAIARYRTLLTSHDDISITTCGFHISSRYPFIGASPDALVQCNCCGEGVVEIKCPFWAKDKTIQESCESYHTFCLETVEDQRQLKADHPYYWQCQVQMFCSGRSYCDFVLWTNKDIHIERILFNETLVEKTIATAKEFHVQCVLPELLGKWFSRQHATLPQ